MHRTPWLAALLVVLLAAVVESSLRSEADRTTGAPVVEDSGGRRLMLVILDSLTPGDAESMPVVRAAMQDGFRATVEPCLDRLTKMCIDEAMTGRESFSLFGLLRNLGPLQDGPGVNLLRDARAAGRKVAMVSAGDLTAYDGDVDKQSIFKGGYSKKEMARVTALAKDHDLVVYHYRWHDSISHRARVGSRRYKRSLRTMDKAMSRLLRALPSDMDLMIIGDHGHTRDGRHLQGLDVPTVVTVSSTRVAALHPDGRIPLTAVRFLAGVVMGLHSPDSRWEASWASWLTDEVSPEISSAVSDKALPTPKRGLDFSLALPLLAFAGLVWWVGGWWAALAVVAVGLGMGLGLEDFVARVHNAKGWVPRMQTVSWMPLLAGGLIGLLARLRWRDGWTGVLIATGLVLAILFPINAHYGVMKNATNLLPALTIGAGSGWLFHRRGWLAVPVCGLSVWAWSHLSWVRFVNLEVRTYKSFRWMSEQPELAAALVGGLAGLLALALLRDRLPVRMGWAVVAALGPVVPLPDSARMGIFVLLCGVWLMGPKNRIFILVQAAAWCLPLLFHRDQQAGVLAVPLATGLTLLALRGAPNRDWRWRWTGGLTVLLAGYVSMGWTMGLSVSGIDFGFLVRFLPGDLHERLWWLVGMGTIIKVFLPLFLISAMCWRILGEPGRAIMDTAGKAAAIRVAIIGLCVGGWLLSPGSSAGGEKLAAVIQDAFYWALIGGLGTLSWAALARGQTRAQSRAS